MIKTKYICDRCGKEIDPYPFGVRAYKEFDFLLWEKNYSNEKTMLCKECFKSFKEWLGRVDCNGGVCRNTNNHRSR